MKNRYVLIILISTILGILIGIVMKEYEGKSEMHTGKDKSTRKEIYAINKSIKQLNKDKETLEKSLEELKDKYYDAENIKSVESIKSNLSYTDVTGSGIVIDIDAINEDMENIANLIDYNKILIKLVNEIKINGARFISINEERLNQYSEIVLAGNHINVNSIPIAPPYEIKVIGDTKKLHKYLSKENTYLSSIEENYPIKLEFKIDEKISMKKMNTANKLEYIKGD